MAAKAPCWWPGLGEPIRPSCALGQVSSQLKAAPRGFHWRTRRASREEAARLQSTETIAGCGQCRGNWRWRLSEPSLKKHEQGGWGSPGTAAMGALKQVRKEEVQLWPVSVFLLHLQTDEAQGPSAVVAHDCLCLCPAFCRRCPYSACVLSLPMEYLCYMLLGQGIPFRDLL